MSAGERVLLDRLHKRYSATSMGAARFAVAEHVADRPGWASRIADFMAQDTYTTWLEPNGRPGRWQHGEDGRGGYGQAERRTVLHGHEIKVSRSDWLRELADPTKAEAFARYCDQWWLVVSDKSIVKPGELPDSWGLMVMTGTGLRAAVSAPRRDPEPMPVMMRASLMRAVAATATRRQGVQP